MPYGDEQYTGGNMSSDVLQRRALEDMKALAFIKESLYSLIKSYETFKNSTLFFQLLTLKLSTTMNTDLQAKLSSLDKQPPMVPSAEDIKSVFDTLSKKIDHQDLSAIPAELSTSTDKIGQDAIEIGKDISDITVFAASQFLKPLPAIGTSTTMDSEYVDQVKRICAKLYQLMFKRVARFVNAQSMASYKTVFPNKDSSQLETMNAKIVKMADKLTTQAYVTFDLNFEEYRTNVYRELFSSTSTDIKNAFNEISPASSTEAALTLKRNLFFACFQPFFMMWYTRNFIAEKEIQSAVVAPPNFQIRRLAILTVYTINRYILYMLYELTIKSNTSKTSPSTETAIVLRQLLDTQVTTTFANEDVLDIPIENVVEQQNRINADMANQINRNNRDIELTRNKVENIAIIKSRLNSSYTYANVYYWLWIITLLVFTIYSVVVLFLRKYKLFYIGAGVIYIWTFISVLVYLFKKI